LPDEPNLVVLQNGKFDTSNGSNAEGLKQIFAGLAAKPPERFVLYFHGGLVSRENAIAGAKTLEQELAKSGAASLFVIWESGLTEIISQKLPKIFQEDLFQSIHLKVSQFVKAKLDKMRAGDAGKGAGLPIEFEENIQKEIDKGAGMFADIPIHEIPEDAVVDPDSALSEDEKTEIVNKVDRDPTLRHELSAVAAGRAEAAGSKDAAGVEARSTLMDAEVLQTLVPPEEKEGGKFALSTIQLGKHIVFIVGGVIWRFVKRRDHGPYLTIVEEIMREFYVRAIGRFAWTGMKDSIEQAFKPGNGGSALVDEIQKLWQDGVRPGVTLIGHSAGAIYVARLLRALHKAMDPKFKVNIALIAPACTCSYLHRRSTRRKTASPICGSLAWATRSSARTPSPVRSIPPRCSISSRACWRTIATSRWPEWSATIPAPMTARGSTRSPASRSRPRCCGRTPMPGRTWPATTGRTATCAATAAG
jgi:hypothetical protein